MLSVDCYIEEQSHKEAVAKRRRDLQKAKVKGYMSDTTQGRPAHTLLPYQVQSAPRLTYTKRLGANGRKTRPNWIWFTPMQRRRQPMKEGWRVSKVTTNLVANEQKHHQIQSNGINALSGDHEVIHKMLTTFLALREIDRKEDKAERDQFQGMVMKTLLQMEERLEALELLH